MAMDDDEVRDELRRLRREVKALRSESDTPLTVVERDAASRARAGKVVAGKQVKDHGGISSDEWCTGPDIAIPLFEFWGVADCDPCSNDRSLIRARHKWSTGGLIRSWLDKTYENHPYSQNEPWADKAIYEMKVGHVSDLVVLCMTATSTRWWRRFMIEPRRNPRVILTKRLKFLGPSGKPVDSSRFEPALIYFGSRAKAFDKHFAHVAMWSTWGR